MSNQHSVKVIIGRLCLLFVLALTPNTPLGLHVMVAEPTLEELKVNLRSSEAKVRRKAASELGKTKSRDAVQPLLAAASDRDVSVREEVVKSLGILKDQEALTMLLTTIKDPAESVREESIIALVNLYADRDTGWVVTRTAKKAYKTINPFSDQVGDDATIIEAYVQVAPVAIDSIADRLLDSSPAVRLDAAKALGVLRARPAVPKMIDAMKTGDANLRIALLRSLYKIRDASVDEQILPYLNDSDKNVRDETIVTLGLFRSKKALPELKRIYDQNPDTKLRLKAFQALALIGDGSTLDLFQAQSQGSGQGLSPGSGRGCRPSWRRIASGRCFARFPQRKGFGRATRPELCPVSAGAQRVSGQTPGWLDRKNVLPAADGLSGGDGCDCRSRFDAQPEPRKCRGTGEALRCAGIDW